MPHLGSSQIFLPSCCLEDPETCPSIAAITAWLRALRPACFGPDIPIWLALAPGLTLKDQTAYSVFRLSTGSWRIEIDSTPSEHNLACVPEHALFYLVVNTTLATVTSP